MNQSIMPVMGESWDAPQSADVGGQTILLRMFYMNSPYSIAALEYLGNQKSAFAPAAIPRNTN